MAISFSNDGATTSNATALGQTAGELQNGERHGVAKRVASQLGIGVETLRRWVNQAEIDGGLRPGLSTPESEQLKALAKENRELKRANEILIAAATFFGAALDRQQKR